MTIETILPIPDIFSARRVLCIQPHYDDNDIGASGTLALLKQSGAQIIYLTATDDLMGVVDVSLPAADAASALDRDQLRAGTILGVDEQINLGYPDAGEYNYFSLRRDLLKYIRLIQPDFVFTPDPWLTYEGHHDHIQTGLAASEAVMFRQLLKIASSDLQVDNSYDLLSKSGDGLRGIAFYYTREPNLVVDITPVWETKVSLLRCYETQFDPAGLDELVYGMDLKSRQVAEGQLFERGEALKVLDPRALHCAI